MTEERAGYPAILKVSLPPEEQYHSGHSLILQAEGPVQLGMLLTELEQVENPVLRRILTFARDGVAASPVLTSPQSPNLTPVVNVPQSVTLTPEQAAEMLGGGTVGPVEQPVVVQPTPAPVPQPVAAPQQGTDQYGQLDGSVVGGTPGQKYPSQQKLGAPLQLGGPCSKCGVLTFWNPPGVNYQTKLPFQGYFRCPNTKNHPK